MGDSPLGWCDGEASASGRLRWPVTSMGSSCSTRPTRGRGEGEAHGWAAEEGWGGAHLGGGVGGGTQP
jgi:hypothetical protein